LIALDLLYVREPWASDVRRAVARSLDVEPAAVMIAATHSHAGPAVFRSAMVQTDELIDYEQHLAAVIEAAVAAARDTLRPVVLSFGSAHVQGVAANRQEYPGETGEPAAFDDEVRILLARSANDRVAGVVASFGCHPTVLSAANLAYSRDLFGAAVDIAEQECGAPVVLFNGAAADVSTRFTRTAQTPKEVARLGGLLAAGIAGAIRNAKPIADEPIAGRVLDVAVEPRRLPSIETAQREVSLAASRIDEARSRVSPAELRRLISHLEGAMAQLYLSENGGAEALVGRLPSHAALQVLQLGGIDVLGVPGEMFSAVGSTVCQRGPRAALLVGYANDYIGYLVPSGAAAGYEALMAFVTTESADAIATALANRGDRR
jgi:hypothetical protein